MAAWSTAWISSSGTSVSWTSLVSTSIWDPTWWWSERWLVLTPREWLQTPRLWLGPEARPPAWLCCISFDLSLAVGFLQEMFFALRYIVLLHIDNLIKSNWWTWGWGPTVGTCISGNNPIHNLLTCSRSQRQRGPGVTLPYPYSRQSSSSCAVAWSAHRQFVWWGQDKSMATFTPEQAIKYETKNEPADHPYIT